jgi:hypothetical protein
MADSEIRLIPGPSGWVQARFGRHHAFIRLEPDAQGRWQAAEWNIPAYPPDVLRRIPHHRILQAVKASDRLIDELANRFEEEAEPGFRHAFGEPERGKPILITRPRGRRLDDSFYARVAFVYRQAVGRGLKPRAAIAEAADVSPDVAGRWIYEARKRGLIPKTRPGKVTVSNG